MSPLLSVALAVLGTSPCPDPAAAQQFAEDPVAVLLSRYRAEADPGRRAELLKRLARSGDPRAAVALGEALTDRASCARPPTGW
jgi:hypothetical protein